MVGLAVAALATLPACRRVGSSAIQVSQLAFGTMMFGAWGNPDRTECRRMSTSPRCRDHAVRHGRHLRLRCVRTHARRSSLGGRRHGVVLATKFGNPMDDDPAAPRRLAPVGSPGGHRQPATAAAPTASTCTRCTVPTADVPSTRRSARSTRWCRKVSFGAVGTSTFPSEQLVESQWASRTARPRSTGERTAAVFDPVPRCRASRVPDVPPLRRRRASYGRRSTEDG